jgi:ribosomal protein bL25 (Ctc-form)
MKSVPLNAFPRTLSRRGGVKKLRASGRIPAVVYGRQAKAQNLEVIAKEMGDLIHHSLSENVLVDLAVKDDARPKRLALVQEVQHHPLSGDVLHVDLHEVAEDEKVTINVPLKRLAKRSASRPAAAAGACVVQDQVRAPKDLLNRLSWTSRASNWASPFTWGQSSRGSGDLRRQKFLSSQLRRARKKRQLRQPRKPPRRARSK